MDDKTKLAIREEVEQRLNAPPASFVDRIENEVEKRIEQRVRSYKTLAIVLSALITAFGVILWNVTLSTVQKTITDQLSENEVLKAKDRILTIKSDAEAADRIISAVSTSMSTNQRSFVERLNEIKQQDNVILAEDLPRLFIRQVVTNILGGTNIIADYEPIPSTVKMIGTWHVDPGARVVSRIAFLNDGFGFCDGKNIVLTNSTQVSEGQIIIEYVRKSIR